ncbi:NUDIX hydrolase [Mycolicibacterium vanbaalenii]|nr:NUDIX domain-containing protein [Mycolicibacterium vanbaalenii]MCV7130026.1 NUDIX hydrolase [Mycolicibacterium vanbaalenii PYR-1]
MSERRYRDSSDKTLADYPRPSVAVDTAVLTLDEQQGLVVLQVRRPNADGWALPGTFLHEGETLAMAVARSLQVKANVEGLLPRQLHVFDALDRDPRGWVLSVAHVDVVQPARLEERFAASTRLMPVRAPGRLPFDHPEIVRRAVEYLQSRYADRPDPDRLLGEEFTILQLRRAHEQIAGRPLQRDWFRRTMEPQLEPTGQLASGARGRPAELFHRREPGS